MPIKSYILAISCFLFLHPFVYAQYKVIKVQDSITEYFSGKGFFYTLPKNYFSVQVKVTKTQRYKGPFAEYAEKLLGLSGAIKENASHYLIKELNLSLEYKPDLSQLYFVEYPKNPKDTLWHQFFTSGLAINNMSLDDKGSNPNSMQVAFFYPNEAQQAQFEMYDNYTLYEKIDTNYETKYIDSAYVRIPVIEKRMVEKTTEQKAQEALEQIKKIREAQWLLLTGDHEVDFSNLNFMISSLKEQEKTYLSLFTGFTITEESEYILYFDMPEKQNEINIPLFSFSNEKGINQQIQADETIYSIQMVNKNRTTPIQAFLENQNRDNKKNKQSFYYRIPEYYQTYIYRNNTEIKNTGVIPINQYGIIDVMPDNIQSFEIDKLTGNITNIFLK
ncbi:MAG: DUF4831 family protein [Bacteroidales bacterium]|nr:DUF4831 family protein [Bacteroidales bacterium]